MLPRVVGLLPTYNRPELAHRAAHLFIEQGYGGRLHLLVFDDGELPVPRPCSTCDFELVRHARVNLPTKRNRMMAHVSDPDAIYVMWDDDDYHGPARVRRQVEALAEAEADACVLRPTLYYNQATRELRRSAWLSDATVAFRWNFWLAMAFDESRDPGSGRSFIRRSHLVNQPTIVEIDGELDYITVVHPGQRHTPPEFNSIDFTEAPVGPEFADARLQLR